MRVQVARKLLLSRLLSAQQVKAASGRLESDRNLPIAFYTPEQSLSKLLLLLRRTVNTAGKSERAG